jgi:hypothetical protein
MTTKKMLLTLLTWALAGGGGTCLSVGCSALYEGGGELAIGFRMDNVLILTHTVDGDKVGKTATFAVEAPALLDMIAGDGDDAIGTVAEESD